MERAKKGERERVQGRNLLAYFSLVLRAARDVVFANCWAHRRSRDTLFCSFVCYGAYSDLGLPT